VGGSVAVAVAEVLHGGSQQLLWGLVSCWRAGRGLASVGFSGCQCPVLFSSCSAALNLWTLVWWLPICLFLYFQFLPVCICRVRCIACVSQPFLERWGLHGSGSSVP
jgi:hypothetical protein